MKKIYLRPTLHVEGAQPAILLCESLKSNVGLESSGGSTSEAHAPEWEIWGDEE